jgi:hypothetical protein
MYLFCLETKKVPKKIQGCTAILRLRCAKKLKKRLFSKTRLPVSQGHRPIQSCWLKQLLKSLFLPAASFFTCSVGIAVRPVPEFRVREFRVRVGVMTADITSCICTDRGAPILSRTLIRLLVECYANSNCTNQAHR